MASGPSFLYVTTEDSKAVCDFCASSTGKKDQVVMDSSAQATTSSWGVTLTEQEKQEVIASEQLRFTAAISKVMSKELAPLLAAGKETQAKPNVYRVCREGSIEG